MSATTFLLIRHGLNDWVGRGYAGRTAGVHLNERGRAQAKQLSERLAGSGVRALYSSPLERCRETAEPLSRALDLPVKVREPLNEVDVGEWTGKRFEELSEDARWQRWNAFRGGVRAPGGEMMGEVEARVVAELERLAQAHPGAKVAVFSHADVIRAAIAHFLGMPLEHILRLEIETASVSVLHFGEWGPQLAALNAGAPGF